MRESLIAKRLILQKISTSKRLKIANWYKDTSDLAAQDMQNLIVFVLKRKIVLFLILHK